MCATLTLHSSNGCIDIQDAIQLNLSAPTKSTSPPSLFSRRKLYKYDYTAGQVSLPYASPADISELRRHIRIIRAQLRSYLF